MDWDEGDEQSFSFYLLPPLAANGHCPARLRFSGSGVGSGFL